MKRRTINEILSDPAIEQVSRQLLPDLVSPQGSHGGQTSFEILDRKRWFEHNPSWIFQ
jgi:hypothetical protein